MIARCGVTAERQHVDCWVSSPAAPNLASHQKSVSHEFCTPAASSFVHHAAYAGYVVMNAAQAYSVKRCQADCWSVSTLAAKVLPASSKGVPQFVPLLLVHLCNILPNWLC
jgi:hypothetical protein